MGIARGTDERGFLMGMSADAYALLHGLVTNAGTTRQE
jgi:hypothetical protein